MRQFIQARALDPTAQTEDAKARALLGAELFVPGRALLDDVRHIADGLDVVDHGGLAIEAFDGREGRLKAWMAAIPFQRSQQRRLFAALVRASAAMDDDVQFVRRAKQVLAQEAPGPGLGNRFRQARVGKVVFAADVDKGLLTFHGIGRQDDAFDQLVRVILHDHAVFEGARLGLIRVDHQVARVDARGQKAPFGAGWKTSAAAAAHVGGFHLFKHILGRLGGQCQPRGFISAALHVHINRV